MDSCALSDSVKERLAIILRKSLTLFPSGAPLFVMTASFKQFAAAALAALTLLSGAAQADEQSVRDQLMKNTGLKADSVRPTPIPGLWEVFIHDRLFYVDDKVDYVFSGSIIDTKTQTNQTQERLREWARSRAQCPFASSRPRPSTDSCCRRSRGYSVLPGSSA